MLALAYIGSVCAERARCVILCGGPPVFYVYACTCEVPFRVVYADVAVLPASLDWSLQHTDKGIGVKSGPHPAPQAVGRMTKHVAT